MAHSSLFHRQLAKEKDAIIRVAQKRNEWKVVEDKGRDMSKTEFWSIMALGVAILASTTIQLANLNARVSDNTRAIADNSVAVERAVAPLYKEMSHIRVDIANLDNRLIREVLTQRNEIQAHTRRVTEIEEKDSR